MTSYDIATMCIYIMIGSALVALVSGFTTYVVHLVLNQLKKVSQ